MGVIKKVGEKEWEKESVKRENGRERESESAARFKKPHQVQRRRSKQDPQRSWKSNNC